jgi:amino acid adenylation domain-containing protein
VSDARSVPGMIAARAAAAPEDLPVAEATQRTTYGTLDVQANRLARRLIAHGAGRGRIVVLLLPRSIALVVAALGTLRTGAAYAPCDPATPPRRLVDMLADAEPAVVLTLDALLAQVPAGPWTTVAIDREADSIEREMTTAPEIRIEPSDLAYVIYTSGSTGRPKGVELTHGGLLNLVRWHRAAFAVTAADRAPLLASPGFDASVWEMWPYLASGASLHVTDERSRLDPEALRDWLVAHDTTLAFVSTPLAERLLTLPWPADAHLRTLLTGADTLHHRPPPGARFTLVNNYGPTECTVVATSGCVPPDPLAEGLPSIGQPIDNVRAYVLDDRGDLVGEGQEGELYVGGPGVARGYRNMPELTAERFVPDPFGPDGARLYRTGDRARWRPDGSLAFLGRVDDQVKVRGHRVEPEEIVAALGAHPGVEAAAVIARPAPDGTSRLVAYVVAPPAVVLTPAALRTTLRDRLPEYMLPAVFVRLTALPLSASGKLDRTALPAPETVETLRDRQYVAPRTAVERRLAALLSELLAMPIGVGDNFFLLGGHSLLGTQLIARVRNAFGVDLPLRTVFDHPTVEDLALEIEQALLARMEAA